jgi:hypothetical protein
MSSKFLIIGTFLFRFVRCFAMAGLGYFVRGLLHADAAHMVGRNRSSRRFCELMEAAVALISLLFSPRCSAGIQAGLV